MSEHEVRKVGAVALTAAPSFCRMRCIMLQIMLGISFGDAMFIASGIPEIGEKPENPDKSTVSEENR